MKRNRFVDQIIQDNGNVVMDFFASFADMATFMSSQSTNGVVALGAEIAKIHFAFEMFQIVIAER